MSLKFYIELLIDRDSYFCILFYNEKNIFQYLKKKFFLSEIDEFYGPGKWYPSVSLIAGSNGILTVAISLSPERFNLTVFKLRLLKNSSSIIDTYREEIFYTQVIYFISFYFLSFGQWTCKFNFTGVCSWQSTAYHGASLIHFDLCISSTRLLEVPCLLILVPIDQETV